MQSEVTKLLNQKKKIIDYITKTPVSGMKPSCEVLFWGVQETPPKAIEAISVALDADTFHEKKECPYC